MINFRVPVLLSVIFILIATLACSVPGVSGSTAVPTSTLIDINALTQPTIAPPSGDSSGGSTGTTSGACANSLYPVVVGASWTYSLTGPQPDTFTRTITAVNPDGFTDQDVFNSGVTRTGQWKCDAGSLIGLDPNDTSVATANVQTNNLNVNFTTTAMDGVSFPATVAPGVTWTQSFTIEGNSSINGQEVHSKNQTTNTCTAGATESVAVPAGSFNAVHVGCQTSILITITMNGSDIPTSLNMTSTAWYAPGVGMVRNDSILQDGSTTKIELTSYHIP